MKVTTIPGGRGVEPDEDLAAATRRLIERLGEGPAAEQLGIHRGGLARICGRLPMQAGTLLLARTRLAELAVVGAEAAK